MKISTSILLMLLSSGNAFAAATGNPMAGEELFKQCSVCHQLGADAQNTIGPELNHLLGRKAGTVEDANYSDAMRAKGSEEGLIWQEKTLFQFLAGPERYIPGTIMGFEGLKTEKQIKDILAFLLQFSPAYVPDSLSYVAPEIAAASTLPEVRSDSAVEAVPEFTEEFMASTDSIENGGKLWAMQCRHCHGNSAYPGKAPKLTPSSYKPEFVFDRITNGFRKMPAWKTTFTLDERKDLVAHILSSHFSP